MIMRAAVPPLCTCPTQYCVPAVSVYCVAEADCAPVPLTAVFADQSREEPAAFQMQKYIVEVVPALLTLTVAWPTGNDCGAVNWRT